MVDVTKLIPPNLVAAVTVNAACVVVISYCVIVVVSEGVVKPPNSNFHTLAATALSFAYPLGTMIVTLRSSVRAEIWYSPCGVWRYEASVLVAEATMADVENGVPALAVAVRVVPVPVVVSVPVTKGSAAYICRVSVVVPPLALANTV